MSVNTAIHAVALAAMMSVVVSAQTIEAFTEPYETVQVASPESGIVSSIELKEGQPVSAGQVVCHLDNDVLKASLEGAQVKAAADGVIAAAEATVALSDKRHAKLAKLNREGHASLEEVERAASDLAIARANLLSAREQSQQYASEVKRIESQIERRMIRSPIDGVVLRLHKHQGEMVSATDANVATLVNLDKLKARFYLPTLEAVRLSEGATVQVLFPATRGAARGRVEFISPVTDSDSGTVRVEIVIDNTQRQYRSGVRCTLQAPRPLASN